MAKTSIDQYRISLLVLLATVALLSSGCSRSKIASNVVVTVGNETISTDDIMREWDRNPFKEPNPSLQARRVFINNLIRRKVLEIAARAENFKVENAPAHLPVPSLSTAYEQKLRHDLQANDQEAHTYYLLQIDYYKQPLETGNHIFARTMEQAQKVQAFLANGQSFGDVAWQLFAFKQKPTTDMSAIPPFRKGDRPKEFEDAFFALQPGQTSGITPIFSGYEIIRRGEPQTHVSYAAIEKEIRDLLTRKAVQNKIQGLINTTPVKVDEKRLADLPL